MNNKIEVEVKVKDIEIVDVLLGALSDLLVDERIDVKIRNEYAKKISEVYGEG